VSPADPPGTMLIVFVDVAANNQMFKKEQEDLKAEISHYLEIWKSGSIHTRSLMVDRFADRTI